MNSYKITYVAGEGETEQTYITERTEAAARKFFKKVSDGREIVDVELYDTEATATKEQERETNIENDFAFSMKARVDSLEEQLKEMGSKHNSAKRDTEVAQKALADAEAQLAAAQEQIAALKRQQLPEELRRDLWVMTTTEAEASRVRMAEAAEKMAGGADNPGCVLFKDAVALYRVEKARAEAMDQRAAELEAMEQKNN